MYAFSSSMFREKALTTETQRHREEVAVEKQGGPGRASVLVILIRRASLGASVPLW
jgi:hypothetical protein